MGFSLSLPAKHDFSSLIIRNLSASSPLMKVLPEITADLHGNEYALVRLTSDPSSRFVICASQPDFPVNNVPDDFFDGELKVEVADDQDEILKCGYPCYLTSVYIQEHVALIFVSHHPLSLTQRDQDMLSEGLEYLLKLCPYDIDFLLDSVARIPADKISNLRCRGFSIAMFGDDDLFMYVIRTFTDLLEKLHVDKKEFVRLAVDIRNMYNHVPYHNWRHAADATQFVYSVIKVANVERYLSDLELFAMLFAAMCHDTDHDGLNNTFQRKAQTSLAQLAPDLPPLEMHHANVAITTLNMKHKGVLERWNEQAIGYFEKFVIRCILATDMERHKTYVEEFSHIRQAFDKENEEHRILLGQIIIKAADLSNTVRNFSDAASLSKKLSDECFRQGDKETQLGLEISPMCDRNNATPVPKGQIGFYSFVAGPLMAELHAFFPELQENEKQFQSNLQHWKELAAS